MKKWLVPLACVAILALAGGAFATTLDFEDLTSFIGYGFIATPYHGFEMTLAGFVYKNLYTGSGFYYGTTGNVSMADLYDSITNITMAMPNGRFDLVSADITSGWNTGEHFTVEGWRNGVKVYTFTDITSYNGPYSFTFNFLDIDKVIFISGTDGVNAQLPPYYGDGQHLCIDNVVYNTSAVPLPASVLLMGSGLLCLSGLGLRRRFRR